MLGSNKRIDACFHQALAPAAALGSAVCGSFLAGAWFTPLRNTSLFRYAFCHPLATAAIWLGCIASAALWLKWRTARYQFRIAKQARESLDELVEHRGLLPGEADLHALERAEGLDTLWRTQKRAWTQSWFGQRVSSVIARQLQRRSVQRLEEDLQELAARALQSQRESYSLITLLVWSAPVLGVLGCMASLSGSLGQLASQSPEGQNPFQTLELMRGLAAAFDPLLVAVAMTSGSLFLRFLAQREEVKLMNWIDDGVHSALHRCLSQSEVATDTSAIEAELRAISTKLTDSVDDLVRRQIDLWRDAIGGAHDHWQHLATGASETALIAVRQAIGEALEEHRQKLREDVERLTALQSDGAAQIDARLQQWQTTISEQARVSLRHQQELNRQTETLERLMESSQLVAAMQAPMKDTLEQLSDMQRFHEAAVSLSEAITVLGAQVEQIAHASPSRTRRSILRRRTPSSESELASASASADDASLASIDPSVDLDRREPNPKSNAEPEAPPISIPIASHFKAPGVYRTNPSATSSRTRRAG